MSYFPIKISIIAGLVFLAFLSFFSFMIFSTSSVLEGMVTSIAIGVITGSLAVSFFVVGDFNDISTKFVTKNSFTLGLAVLVGGSGIVIFFGGVLLDWLNVLQGMFIAICLFALAGWIGLYHYSSKFFKTNNNKERRNSVSYARSEYQPSKTSNIDYEGEASIKYKKKITEQQKLNNEHYCDNCGSLINDSLEYCSNCGASQK